MDRVDNGELKRSTPQPVTLEQRQQQEQQQKQNQMPQTAQNMIYSNVNTQLQQRRARTGHKESNISHQIEDVSRIEKIWLNSPSIDYGTDQPDEVLIELC